MAVYLSPARLRDADKISKRTGAHIEEVYEALRERNGVPRFAEEYLKNSKIEKKMTDEERYPLWYQYLLMVDNGNLY